MVEVFPPEPPVAVDGRLQRRGAGKGAKRRSEPLPASTVVALARIDGRASGTRFPLVSLEAGLRTAEPTTAEEQNATIDQSDIRGSEPHGHDPSGAASH
jgi:hypothetical protein